MVNQQAATKSTGYSDTIASLNINSIADLEAYVKQGSEISVALAVGIWAAFRFVLGVDF